MKFLAIDTAGPKVQVALSNGKYRLCEENRGASAFVMPAVDELLTESGWKPNELDFIACVIGPGSFTGIRIGVSSARAMCYALGKPAVGIHYLQMLAYNKKADGKNIMCVSDGSNGTAYLGIYDGARREVAPTICLPVDEAVRRAAEFDGAVCVDDRILTLLPHAVGPDDDCASLLRAAEAGESGATAYAELVPVYVRESQAERDAAAKS